MEPWDVGRILLIASPFNRLGRICEYRYFLAIPGSTFPPPATDAEAENYC